MIGEPFSARFVKWRVLLILAASVGFVVLGLWVAGVFGEPPRPEKAWFGWIAVALFGLFGMLAVPRLFDNDVQVRIAGDGIYSKQWSETTIPWREITDIGVWQYKRQKSIVLVLRDPSAYPSSSFLGRMAKANKAMTGGDVVISLLGTDKSFDEGMAAIERFWRP